MDSVTARAPARTKTRIQARNEKRILEAARDVFAQYGYHGATIDKVAEKADMSKPNLHYYFKKKRDLYVAVLRATLDAWNSPLVALNPDGDPEAELRSYIAQKVEMSRKNPVASRLFATEVLQGAPFIKPYLETEMKALVEQTAAVLERWMTAGKLRRVDPYHLIFLIWAATQHYADFAPQVETLLDRPRLSKADFGAIETSLTQIILDGALSRAGSA